MHIFFRGVRVHKRKEFFATSTEDINNFFDIVEGKITENDDCFQWSLALDKAAMKRDKHLSTAE